MTQALQCDSGVSSRREPSGLGCHRQDSRLEVRLPNPIGAGSASPVHSLSTCTLSFCVPAVMDTNGGEILRLLLSVRNTACSENKSHGKDLGKAVGHSLILMAGSGQELAFEHRPA